MRHPLGEGPGEGWRPPAQPIAVTVKHMSGYFGGVKRNHFIADDVLAHFLDVRPRPDTCDFRLNDRATGFVGSAVYSTRIPVVVYDWYAALEASDLTRNAVP